MKEIYFKNGLENRLKLSYCIKLVEMDGIHQLFTQKLQEKLIFYQFLKILPLEDLEVILNINLLIKLNF